MDEQSRRVAECGKQLAMATTAPFTVNGSIHPPTLVLACARMAGTYVFRSLHLDPPGAVPGDAVLSAGAAAEIPRLLLVCASILKSLGKTVPEGPPAPLDQPAKMSRVDLLETQALLDPLYAPLQQQFALDDLHMARAAAVATAMKIFSVSKVLDHVTGFGLAACGFSEGSQTTPRRWP